MFNSKDVKKLLIMRWGSMGDLAICSAVINDICKHFSDVEIQLNVEPPWDKLFQGDTRFSKIHNIKVRKAPRLGSTRAWLSMLRREKFDLIIDLQCNDRSMILLNLARLFGIAPKYRMGTKSGLAYNLEASPYGEKVHALEILRAAAKGLGVDCQTEQPVLSIPNEYQQSAEALLREHGLQAKSFAVLVPGSSLSGAKKRWGVKNYTAMAELFFEQGVDSCAILGGPDEIELCTQLADSIGEKAVNLCGKTQLLEIPVIAEQAQYMVSNDTGTAHLAAAADIAMVVICGPTDASRVHPIGKRVATLQAPMECFAQHPAEQCMAKVSPSQVWQALENL